MDSKNTTSGITTLGALGILFVALKLTNVIDWPWIWVLGPFWIPIVIVIGIFLIILLLALFVAPFRNWVEGLA